MSSTTVLVNSDVNGDFSYERPMFANVKAILVDVGTLGTPDIEVTDGTYGTSVLSLVGATSDAYAPAGSFSAVLGTLSVEVTGAAPSSHGRLRFLLET